MNEWNSLALLMAKCWEVFNTPMLLPWIGNTSPLKLSIYLALLGLLVDFVAGTLGGKNDE
jgi:hypothetical protein